MADINQLRFAPLLWPSAQHPANNSTANKVYDKPKERAYRNPQHEQQNEQPTDSDKHLDEYA